MKKDDVFKGLCEAVTALGGYKASVISTKDISCDRCFRDMCASNACGVYGKCYMCPPDVGDIDKLMNEISEYSYALVYQTVTRKICVLQKSVECKAGKPNLSFA